ncbi:MAG: hypothetical protein ACPG7F_22350, partial [Aggregatilineales bacterium]
DTRGDEQFGRISETRFTVNGFGAMLNLKPISPVRIEDNSSPSAWGHIENPTPVRALVYLVTEHTTFFNLCAFSFPSNHTDYIAPGHIFESSSDVTAEAMRYQADAMDCILQFGRDGIIDMQRNLVQDNDTARNAADVIATFTPDDFESFTIDFDPNKQIKFYQLHAGVYNTATGTYDVFQAFIPPLPDNRGTSTEQRTNVILTTNSSLADAQTEFGERAANLYAALNPTVILRGILKDEWSFLQADVGAWCRFTIASTDTIRGRSYDSSSRWQLIEVGYGSNNETGTRGGVSVTFRLETQNTGANIDVAQVRKPTTTESVEYNFKPAFLPPGVNADLEDYTDGEYFESLDPGAPDDEAPPTNSECEQYSFTVPNGATGYPTTTSAVSNENIALTVRGNGKLSSS